MGRTAATAFTATVCAVVLCLPRSVGAANTAPPLFSLAALLTVAPALPEMSRRVLVAETERIWRREGVSLRWSKVRADEAPAAPLRILVIARREAVLQDDDREWAVGELVPHQGQRALAIASIAGAERVLVKAAGHRPPLLFERRDLADYRLGVILGRAVAHEIGHYLLGTSTHAQRGLMRATIDVREFADPGANTFALDETAGQWLRHRLGDTKHADGSLPAPGFTYTQSAVPPLD